MASSALLVVMYYLLINLSHSCASAYCLAYPLRRPLRPPTVLQRRLSRLTLTLVRSQHHLPLKVSLRSLCHGAVVAGAEPLCYLPFIDPTAQTGVGGGGGGVA